MEIVKFKPLLKEVLWGGNKIVPFKHLDLHVEQIGESWEVSGVKDNETVVDSGVDKGVSLNQLVRKYKGKFLGEANYQRFGDEFPLLIKFIDAQKDLSIQVHPTDEKAIELGKKRGKTEMWYVIGATPNATLHVGLKKEITPEEYKMMVENDTICDAISDYPVKEGDCFFLPAGRIHSIGAGCFLAEIQQTSDVTFRIYDFKRKDKYGHERELHTQEAAQSIDYHVYDNYRTEYTPKKNEGVELVSCSYFTTAVYDLDEEMEIDYSDLDSFVILIGIKGESRIIVEDTQQIISFREGETVIIPAVVKKIKIEGVVKFLETFV